MVTRKRTMKINVNEKNTIDSTTVAVVGRTEGTLYECIDARAGGTGVSMECQ